MNSFTQYELQEDILRALDMLGYKEPTNVQQKVIPKALKGQDVIVKARTGSGKTAAFGIPLCELVDWEENKPQALVLTPTRELAAQVKDDIIHIGRFKRINAVALYGKQPFAKQKNELKQKSHMVVGTPGRVLDHIEKGTLSLEKVKYLVIDEADEMLHMGFLEQVESIIDRVPKQRKTMLFSATLPANIEKLGRKYMIDPDYLEVAPEPESAKSITHYRLDSIPEKKLETLHKAAVVENPETCVIFCNTQAEVERVFSYIKQKGYPVDKLHGGMIQEDRFDVMDDFKKGLFRYLVATDVAARGIDVENVTHVISFDVPKEQESYVHRTGRTGRAGRSGTAITIAGPRDERYIKFIEDYIGFSIEKRAVPSDQKVTRALPAFKKSLQQKPERKAGKGEQMNQDILKLYINGGKKKKIRAVDFVGTISNIEGVSAEDIGIISIQEQSSYVDILNGKGMLVLEALRQTTIKGKNLKVHIAKK